MTDILEPFYPCATQKCKERCVDDVCHSEEICLEEVESLRQQLAACQSREKVLRDALETWLCDEFGDISGLYKIEKSKKALALPSDSTALDTLKKQWQREALLEAKDRLLIVCPYVSSPQDWYVLELNRMAKELE